jgi:translation initiation factor IF-2
VKVDEGRGVGRARVYEIAKEVGVPNKELVSKIQALGIDIKNHMSCLEAEDVQRVRRALEKERQENLVEERLTSTVIRRRSKGPARRRKVGPAAQPTEAGAGAQPQQESSAEAAAPGSPVVDEAALAADAAEATAPAEAPQETAEPATDPAAGRAAEQPAESAEAEKPTEESRPSEGETAPAATAPTNAQQPATAAGETAPAKPAEAKPAAKPEAKPEEKKEEKRELRYAPGWKPGMQYGPKARQAARAQHQTRGQPPQQEGEAISAADAMKMMGGAAKPKVVITDLDGRRPGMRREMVTRKDLFSQQRFKGGGKRKKKPVGNKKSKKTEITTPAQHKRVIRIEDGIAVGEMAHQMGIKATEVLKRLWALGMRNVTINQAIDPDTASLLATEFGYEVEDVAFSEAQVLQQVEDAPEDLEVRPPVVTVMGHVDHGKTSLLDAIRDTAVVDGEAGGITQHIGASKVKTPSGELVFLDTPGHEAFTSMRARGAQCTDIVVLVVAADDGVMPQTVEAVDHSRDANVPIIVAVNKIDRPDANTDRVKNELAERGLLPEEWGGETLYVNVSAKTKEGLDTLLDTLHLQADLLELKANPGKPAVGTIIESKLDKTRGAMCTVLVQEGTLRVGDTVVAGEHLGKVRAMLDEHGRQITEAPPSTPVEILGLGGVPDAGDMLNCVPDDKGARTLSQHRSDERKRKEMASAAGAKTMEALLDQLRSGQAKEIKLLLKADVHGSAEATRESLLKLGTEKVRVNVIASNVGGISENDVNLAKAAGAIIVGFNVRAGGKASQLAEREGVEIRTYDVIYEMLDEVKSLMRGMLPKERREKFLGRAEVRETFHIPKVGTVGGCGVQDGKITRNSLLRLVRDNIKIYDGRVGSLKRFKDDVKEVLQGYECGLSIEGYNDIKVGDVIEAYEFEEIAPSLE